MAEIKIPASIRTKLYNALPASPPKPETYQKRTLIKLSSASYLPELQKQHERTLSHDIDKLPLVITTFTKTLISSQHQLKAADESLERLRCLLREKDIELIKSRSENALLKQVYLKSLIYSWNANIRRILNIWKVDLWKHLELSKG
jgi:hypothetical protein